MKTLVVGCGLRPKPGAVNLDKVQLPGVDVVFDLDILGSGWTDSFYVYHANNLPFDDKSFDRIEAEDVIEHVADPITVVQELGRVLKVGGTLWIRGPDETMVWHDLTHRRAFAERTFDGFCPDTFDGKHYGHYHGRIKFKMIEKRLRNHGWEYLLERLPT